MSNQTYESSIRNALLAMPNGTVFAMNDLQDLASYDSLRKVLSRYSVAGHIERIFQGIYRVISNNSETLEPDASEHDVANALARNNNWQIIPGTEMSRFLLGLSDNAPDYFLYLSTGPSNTYSYGKKKKVKFLHSSGKFLNAMSEKSALVTCALMDLKFHNITPHEIAVLSSTLTQEEKSHLMAERMYAPARLRPVFEIICGKYGAK